jgi:hypothetical protein
MSFRDFLAEKYHKIRELVEKDENVSCPKIEDFLEYIENTNVPDISGIDFPADQEIVVENKFFALFTAENANYEGGIIFRSVVVTGEISFRGSWVQKKFELNKVKSDGLAYPENLEEAEVTLYDITSTGEISLPERA